MGGSPSAPKADTTVLDRKKQEIEDEKDKQELANKAAMRARLGRGATSNKLKYADKNDTLGG